MWEGATHTHAQPPAAPKKYTPSHSTLTDGTPARVGAHVVQTKAPGCVQEVQAVYLARVRFHPPTGFFPEPNRVRTANSNHSGRAP